VDNCGSNIAANQMMVKRAIGRLNCGIHSYLRTVSPRFIFR
jgi:hypothetical protein